MKSYSQNQEDLFILNYFGNYKGNLLEVGANDGEYLSNSLALIQAGWQAHLIEPGHTFADLIKLHYTNPKVHCYNYAIGGEFAKELTFYQSGAHVIGGNDSGLVSTLDFEETERWRKSGVRFTETKVPVKTFSSFCNEAGNVDFDFISIDCEGADFDILQQIDLYKVGCKCLCIEHNGNEDLKLKYINYCMDFGLVSKLVNNENIIFTK